MISKAQLVAIVLGLLGCSQPAPSAQPAAPPPSAAAVPAPAPAPPAAPAPEPTPAPTPVAVVPARVTPVGPPRKVVKGSGISITETGDGQVVLKTTATWGEPIDATYADCTFYVAAIPVLSGQLSPARAKLLPRVCAHAIKPKP